jgi:hypothetical protein
MTEEEKTISFMNRYFVFKKTHSVEAAKVSKHMMSAKVEEVLDKKPVATRHRVKRVKQVVLDKYEPVEEAEAQAEKTNEEQPPSPDISPP